MIEEIQNPPDCIAHASPDGSWHLLKLLAHGFAFNLYAFIAVAGRHWELRVPVTVGNFLYRFAGDSAPCGRGWTCFMRPLSDQCPFSTLVARSPRQIRVYSHFNATLVNLCDGGDGMGGRYNLETGQCACARDYFPLVGAEHHGCAHRRLIDDANNPDQRLCRHLYAQYSQDPLAQENLKNFHLRAQAPGETFVLENPLDPVELALPSASIQRARGYFFWHSQLLYYMTQTAPAMEDLSDWLYRRAALMRLHSTCIALHIRRGDSCTDESEWNAHRRCNITFDMFAEQVDRLILHYGAVDYVYLATDDVGAVQRARKVAANRSYELVYQDIDRKAFQLHPGVTVDSSPLFNSQEMIDNIQRDIFAMSTCQSFVGTMSSSVGWVVVELQSARAGHYTPFISMDVAFGANLGAGRFAGHWRD